MEKDVCRLFGWGINKKELVVMFAVFAETRTGRVKLIE